MNEVMLLDAGYYLFRCCYFATLMLLLGSMSYLIILLPRSLRPWFSEQLSPIVRLSAYISLVSALAIFFIQIVRISGDWQGLFHPGTILAVLKTRFGALWCPQLVLAFLACLICFLTEGKKGQRWLFFCVIFQLFDMALMGHAAMRSDWLGGLQRANQAMHLISSAFWAGGLLPLLLLIRGLGDGEKREGIIYTMMSFSRYGHLLVALTLLSGMMNALFIFDGSRPTFSTYTGFLSLKVVLVMLMVLIALANRYYLVPLFRQPARKKKAWRLFVLMTQTEIFLALLVVLLVSIFSSFPPR